MPANQRLFFITTIAFCHVFSHEINLPELYQDVLVHGEVIERGVRSCNDRYQAIKKVLDSLPLKFKALDIGASQGYFSFRMSEEYQARCTMIENGYKITNSVWRTAQYLHYLCTQNSHLDAMVLLQYQFFAPELRQLRSMEMFDLVVAFSVIHHMRHNETDPYENYLQIIDAILDLAPTVLIENPVNTGGHTLFIRELLQKKGGELIYQSVRGSLIYEIYLFDRRLFPRHKVSRLKNIKKDTYQIFNGTYTSLTEDAYG